MDKTLRIELSSNDPWQLLRSLTLFRLLTCLFFVSIGLLPFTEMFIADADPQTLFTISTLYALVASALGLLYWRRQPELSSQVSLQIYCDIIFVTLLMHQLGGVGSGVGILLCASLSAAALLRQEKKIYSFAALATFAVLGEAVVQHLSNPNDVPNYQQAAAFCIALFVVSILSAHFKQHRTESAALIFEQQKRLARLHLLSNEILGQFDHGLLAVSPDGYIAHSNPTAQRLLGCPGKANDVQVIAIAPALAEFLNTGQSEGNIQHRDTELYVTKKRIRGDVQLLTLITQARRNSETQQLKLATLGQWTASVAHEIRNPLSAITQAAQLLRESTEEQTQPRQLADMIHRNSARIDTIVTDILDLARPSKELKEVALVPWLEQLTDELRTLHQLPGKRLTVGGAPLISQEIDTNKLRHVIENLCKNSLAHGNTAKVHIKIEVISLEGNTIIRLSDNGKGIAPEMRSQLFEPFYTAAREGTGLGLFISRQICEQQQISLELCDSRLGAVFELRFHGDTLAQPILKAA